jgi:hypothetical protein
LKRRLMSLRLRCDNDAIALHEPLGDVKRRALPIQEPEMRPPRRRRKLSSN